MRVGVIGGGAAAEGIHLPALARTSGVEVTAIVDPVDARTAHLTRSFGIGAGFSDYRDAIPHMDAAILGIPHQFHAPVAIDLLNAGIHVLVEKPMALTTAECDAMIDASDRAGAVLAVGLLRRFAPTLRWTKDALISDLLGPIKSFDLREGMVFRWPVKSAAMFSPSCGGVTADIGAHALDLMLWWFGDCASFDYWDDAAGGVEADAVIEVKMASGVTGRIELSRTRDLRNSCIIRGERATLEVGTKTDSTIRLTPSCGHDARRPRATPNRGRRATRGSVRVADGRFRPGQSNAHRARGSGAEARAACAHRSVLPPAAAAGVPVRVAASRRHRAGVHREGLMITPLTNATVLVTGATGFIGGRLAERLVVEHGARVRALVRNFGRAARLARFPIDLVQGDLKSAEAVERAVAGCEYVFHCAYGSDGEDDSRRVVNAQGTNHVLDAALRHGCRRVVHTSTVTVYGNTPDGPLDETAPRRKTGFAYGDSKIEAEEAAFRYVARGLSVAVVQPTVVYGPFGTTFTAKPLQELKSGRVILVNEGDGLANLVYVDDVVTGMLLAAVHEAAHGESFLLSGQQPETWRTFYSALETMLGRPGTVSMTAEQALQHFRAAEGGGSRIAEQVWKALRHPGVKRRIASTREGQLAIRAFHMLPASVRARVSGPGVALPGSAAAMVAAAEPPIHLLHPSKVAFMASKTHVRIDKARRMLGFSPQFDFARGMGLTGSWAAWANLLSQ
jgi:nucleoside-diphosphate-sugar epimerase/predicted dehydrogenase